MSNYNITRAFLTNVQYKFTKPDKNSISISLVDSIKVSCIEDQQANINASRTLNFGSKTDSYVEVNYELVITSDSKIREENLREDILNKNIALESVFAQMSLLISHITNMSPFGAIVTPPNYDSKKVAIEGNN